MVGTVIDIETTGWLKFEMVDGISTLSDDSEILEVGYINIDMNTYQILTYGVLYFYKPYFYVESQAQETHGLTREFLEKYELDFDKNLIALNSMIQCTCIIGKNSDKFDIPFVKAFVAKHAGDKFDIPSLVFRLKMKAYSGGYVGYNDTIYPCDVQVIFKEKFHDLYYDRYTYWQMKLCDGRLTPEDEIAYLQKMGHTIDYDDLMAHPPLSNRKVGTLSDYIAIIPDGQKCVDFVYDSFKKDRITGAHGALYDAVMTYIVWMYCAMNKMLT